jgi:uncharacterized repeat protein (TIGR03803 family)
MQNSSMKNAPIAPARSLKSRVAILACMILIALSGATLHAQFNYADVYDFGALGCPAGCVPIDVGQLTRWSDGNFYGSAFQGAGSNDSGTLFRFNPSNGTVNLAWQFTDDAIGFEPNAALSLGSDGNFYGATTQTTATSTSVFRYTPPSTLTAIHNFTPGEGPAVTAPTQARDGNFYGVVGQATYRITIPGGVYQLLPGTISTSPSYGVPLVAGLDGNLYGAAWNYPNNATIFRLTTAGKVKVVHTFDGVHGNVPTGFTLGADGNLYGTTVGGGANATGVIFKFTLPGHKLTVLHSFSSLPSSGQNSDGAEPSNGLLAASDGYLYGATSLGGNNTCGTLFRISTSGSFTKLAEFPNADCVDEGTLAPDATLTENTDGTLYGVTQYNGAGNLYALVPTVPFHNIIFAGPIWVKPGVPVQILGDNLGEAESVTFGGVAGTFQPGSNTYLTAIAPDDAVDGPIVVTLTNPAGGQEQVQSQQNMHILPVINNLDPARGHPGSQVEVAGGGFLGATKVTFGGIKAASFTVIAPNLLQVTVPAGAKTGKIAVTAPNGKATSTQKFVVD